MNKRSRFAIILAVLALCFWFLWPSISWYARTPKDQQSLALGSLEKIKDYTMLKAEEDVEKLISLAESGNETLPAEFSYLEKIARANYKELSSMYKKLGQTIDIPSEMTVSAVLNSFNGKFDPRGELKSVIESRYRDPILEAKRRYENSVKLGLDLSAAQFKKDARAQAIETLTSRIDKFGLTSPVIRQQGEDRIYIEIPGAADSSSVNSIIMGKGILNFRLVDEEQTVKFRSAYNANPAGMFTADGKLSDPSVIADDCEVLGYYKKDDYGLDERIDYLVVKKEIALEGKHVTSARVSADQTKGQPVVSFSLDSEGSDKFAEFTGANVGKRLAIVSDNKIKSAASINERIAGQVQISFANRLVGSSA